MQLEKKDPKALLLSEPERQQLERSKRFAAVFGLELTEADWADLEKSRRTALKDCGLVEFGDGILPKLIEAFCDSPYLAPDSGVETLCDLQEVFYGLRSDAGDWASDEELLLWMQQVFNGLAQGSAEYLAALRPAELMRLAQSGADEEDEKDPLF